MDVGRRGRRRDRGARPLSGRGVVLRFSLVVAVAALAIGTTLHRQIGDQIREQHRGFAESRAVAVTNHVLSTLLDPNDVAQPVDAARADDLDAVIGAQVLHDGLVRVKLWRFDGTVTYSDDRAAIGRRFETKVPVLERVRSDGPRSSVSELGHGENEAERREHTVLMETYVPLAIDGATVGVAELYQDYAPTQAAIAAATRGIDVVLTLTLVTVFVIALLPVRRISWRLSRQAERLLALLGREQDTVQRLRELDRTKDLILAAVSHELRTPLTVIRGLSETLRARDEDLEPARRRELLERLDDKAAHLSRLLTDLLDVDRLARGVVDPQRRPVDLGALIRSSLAEIDVRDRTVVVSVGHPAAWVDPAQVERIVENLVVNALRHAPDGTTIEIRTRPADDGFVLTVEDDGPGVPVSWRTRIFEPFTHGPTAPAHSPGTGIGLALVARLAELHGGHAWVERGRRGGAAFHVLFRDDLSPHASSASPVVDVTNG